VYQHHKNGNRDGVYIDAAFSKTAVTTMQKITTLGMVSQAVYAQPLYVVNGPFGKPAFIVVTETNDVYALDASTDAYAIDAGARVPLWHIAGSMIGNPAVPGANTGCGGINPLGITGTPFISNGVIYFDAMTASGTSAKHLVYAVYVKNGSTVMGWPVDLDATLPQFQSRNQNQRGALQLLGGTLYIPYGGHDGDCTPYYGWVVGIPIGNPQHPTGWHTMASQGGIWGPGALPTDGMSVFPVTGNTVKHLTTWGGGEAVVKIQLVNNTVSFSGNATDYFTPTNWQALDNGDTDLGGASDVVVDIPGASKPNLVVAGGKDGNLYVLDRTNLGGVGGQLLVQQVANNEIKGALGSYKTAMGTYVVFHVEGGSGVACPAGQVGNIVSVLLSPVANPDAGASPFTAKVAWCSKHSFLASPMITTTDGMSNAIVWAAGGAPGTVNKLYGYDGDTGAEIVDGTNTALTSPVAQWAVPIVANGHIVIGINGALDIFAP
jgi:hypothetical protein